MKPSAFSSICTIKPWWSIKIRLGNQNRSMDEIDARLNLSQPEHFVDVILGSTLDGFCLND
jgi:hypothetical protein